MNSLDQNRKPFPGNCHCGNIKVTFYTEKKLSDLWVRVCSCDFCTKQGNRNITDPDGKLAVRIENPEEIFFYQMGHRVGERLFCKKCGVYIVGFMAEEGRPVRVLNLNILEEHAKFSLPTSIDVGNQTPEERVAGRLKRSVPFEFIGGLPSQLKMTYDNC